MRTVGIVLAAAAVLWAWSTVPAAKLDAQQATGSGRFQLAAAVPSVGIPAIAWRLDTTTGVLTAWAICKQDGAQTLVVCNVPYAGAGTVVMGR
jgi:hypothetical protein